MPCYLFTYHAYLSWLPDRSRGFVHRDQGVLPPDPDLARIYRTNAKHLPVTFDDRIQRILIDETLTASQFQDFTTHYVATDPSHVHPLVSWRDDRPWQNLRNGLRSSLTRRLNKEFERRPWFADSASRKQVREQNHFDYLTVTYLADHPGLKWSSKRGVHR